MDRRQKRSREAIFAAFSKLLEKKRYENITVQEIIDLADVGRSTFYAHFETKDQLLSSICADIFQHVFTQTLPQELEYSSGSKNLELKLGHILFHLREHKTVLLGILAGDSARVFTEPLRAYLDELFKAYVADFSSSVPENFLINHLSGSFLETVHWWLKSGEEYSPEQAAGFFMELTKRKDTV